MEILPLTLVTLGMSMEVVQQGPVKLMGAGQDLHQLVLVSIHAYIKLCVKSLYAQL